MSASAFDCWFEVPGWLTSSNSGTNVKGTTLSATVSFGSV